MSISIDLYENKGRLLNGIGDETMQWVFKHGMRLLVFEVTVGGDEEDDEDEDGEEKMPEELTEALRARGYDDGDLVSVIVQ